jgi:predicted secreted protein
MKAKTILSILSGTLILAGCTSTAFKSNKTAIELKGNPTTGYTWMYTIEDESIIQVEEDVQYLGKNGMVGAPSLFKYTIKSRKQGSTGLRFEYKRPWEDGEPEAVQLYEVTVEQNGEITITER